MATISLEDCLAKIVQKTPTRIVVSKSSSAQYPFMRIELESAGSGYQITKKRRLRRFTNT